MNVSLKSIDLTTQLPVTLAAESRVWVYLANRALSPEETQQLNDVLATFAHSWKSHGQPVPAWAGVLLNQFVVLVADERHVGVGGCSIDASVRLLKQVEADFDIQLFERMRFAWWDGDQVQTALRDEFAARYAKGEIDDRTLVFDTLVSTLDALRRHFVKPLSESWHSRMV